MPEFHNEIDEISDLLQRKKNCPIFIGNSITTYERYKKVLDNHVSFIEGDWKRYDSTIRLVNLIISTAIMRLFYNVNNVRADYYFYFIFRCIAVKDYYTPGGKVKRLLHGLPSGTKCTTVLNSINNLFCLNVITNSVNSKELLYVVGGDDFVILCRRILKDYEIESFMAKTKLLGMELKFCDVKDIDSDKLSDFPYFYKYSVRDGLPIVAPTTIPWNKKYNTNSELLEFLDTLFANIGYPNTTHLPFYGYYCYIYNLISKEFSLDRSKLKISDVYKRHLNEYEMYRYSYKKRSSLDNGLFLNLNLSTSRALHKFTKSRLFKLNVTRLLSGPDSKVSLSYKLY